MTPLRPGDHPRSRGVYCLRFALRAAIMGSSPLARGLLRSRGAGVARRRIIPARAGFTYARTPTRPQSADHPRSRGVYSGLDVYFHNLRDHPRSRGVYWTFRCNSAILQGSSPLARGLRAPAGGRGGRSGIIPARAGFTPGWPSRRNSSEDHPRSRGVYDAAEAARCGCGGSSPLARGLLRSRPLVAQPHGIIPARAGFTQDDDVAGEGRADHPRSRGVYPAAPRARSCFCGSSPLARGLQPVRLGDGPQRRIIPARAGFTPRPRCRFRPARDHPRSRGVYRSAACRASRCAGIIPARAGFTCNTPG